MVSTTSTSKLSSSSSFSYSTIKRNVYPSSFCLLNRLKLSSFQWISLFFTFLTFIPSTLGLAQYFQFTPTHNLTIAEGSSQTLPCVVSNLQGSCVWNHNNVAIWTGRPANGDCSFKINKVSLAKHDGLWQCQVTPPLEGAEGAEGGQLVSKPITITVLVRPDKPHIERTPKSAKFIPITANSSEVLTCNVYNGNPLPKIEWFLNDRNITDQAVSRSTIPAVALAKKDVLTISELKFQFSQEHNNQTLSCRAHHPTGSYSDSVTVQVLYIPILAVPREVYSVKEGSEINIDCKVDANPPATVYWKNPARGESVNSDNPRVLYFQEAKRDMNGAIFECNAQNEKGVARPVSVRVDVLYQPHSVNYSSQQSVQTGKSIKLYCFFDGNPKPEVHWFQIDPRTGQHHRIDMPSDNNQILLITNATYSHEGEYYCQATNIINDITNVIKSPPMMLDIYGVPAFPHMEPMMVEGPRGQESHLTLDFCSDPPPGKVHWNYGSVQLEVRSVSFSGNDLSAPVNQSLLRHRTLPLNNIQSKKSPSDYFKCYEARLDIRGTDLNDERDYTLVVQNEYGTASRISRLRVVSPISAGVVVISVLVVIFATILLSFLLMVLMKCQRKPKDGVDDEESGEDSQALSQSINNSEPIKTKPPSEKGNSENYEMVYANLEFANNAENNGGRPIPPTTKPKPAMQTRTSLRGNGTPAGNLAGVMMANQQAVAALAAQHQHQQPNNQQHNNYNNQSLHGTEYAKISFPTKADL